jgi:hypothetical protein
MSFVITLRVHEGIVMASDSRVAQYKVEGHSQTMVRVSDSANKLFLAPNRVGISTWGDAHIKGVPIEGYVRLFMREHISESTPIDEVPSKLLKYFRELEPTLDTGFHVAGYQKQDGRLVPQIWFVDVAKEQSRLLDSTLAYSGDWDTLKRIWEPVAIVDEQDQLKEILPHHRVPCETFNLQDAIDFCVFAVRLTSDAQRFQSRPQTVGGPTDVLLITPTDAGWIQRKHLRGEAE